LHTSLPASAKNGPRKKHGSITYSPPRRKKKNAHGGKDVREEKGSENIDEARKSRMEASVKKGAIRAPLLGSLSAKKRETWGDTHDRETFLGAKGGNKKKGSERKISSAEKGLILGTLEVQETPIPHLLILGKRGGLSNGPPLGEGAFSF